MSDGLGLFHLLAAHAAGAVDNEDRRFGWTFGGIRLDLRAGVLNDSLFIHGSSFVLRKNKKGRHNLEAHGRVLQVAAARFFGYRATEYVNNNYYRAISAILILVK